MAAMILAAGRGERLRPISDTTPKALVEVAGISVLEQQLRRLADANVDTVVINLGWLGEQIAERIGSGRQFGLQVVYRLPLLGNVPFWVLNADIYTDMVLPKVKLGADSLAHLVLVPTPAHKGFGDFELRDGKVRNSDHQDLTYSGIAFYRPEFFADAGGGRFSVVPLLREAADRGQLDGSLYEGAWEDIGTPERLAALNESFG
jgi:MurNAc alpha-1-phosphate uridylyltransferase